MQLYREQYGVRAPWEVIDNAKEDIPNAILCKKCYDELSIKDKERHNEYSTSLT